MTYPTREVVVFGLFLSLACAGGCSAEAGKATVSGEVTLDGKPLKEGVIRFVPADGNSPTADAAIVDGSYQATVPVGAKRVEISAPKVVGKRKMYNTPQSPWVDEVAELIPALYNVKSILTAEVKKAKT